MNLLLLRFASFISNSVGLYLKVQNSQKKCLVEVIQAEENSIKFRLKIYSLKNIYIHNLNFLPKLMYNLCG